MVSSTTHLGEGNADEEPQLGEDRSCGQCTEFLKKEGKKKVSTVPTFRKPGGRMGNVSIDSRSLRSGYGGPGYAAPVARRVVVEKPEVKAIKVWSINLENRRLKMPRRIKQFFS